MDKGQDVPRPGRAEVRYSEFSQPSLRQAAGFAINSFSTLYSSPEMQRRIGAELSDEQLKVASYLREIYNQAFTTLPKVESNAVRSGYGTISSSVVETIPYYLKGPHATEDPHVLGNEQLIKDDPTGVSLLIMQIDYLKNIAKENAQKSEGKAGYVSALYSAIDELVQSIPETQEDIKEGDSFNEVIRKSFNPNPRESARSSERSKVSEETGLVEDGEGNLIPYDELRLIGAEMAFDQYKRAIDFYLNKWGSRS